MGRDTGIEAKRARERVNPADLPDLCRDFLQVAQESPYVHDLDADDFLAGCRDAEQR
jgi:hypothetical protein